MNSRNAMTDAPVRTVLPDGTIQVKRAGPFRSIPFANNDFMNALTDAGGGLLHAFSLHGLPTEVTMRFNPDGTLMHAVIKWTESAADRWFVITLGDFHADSEGEPVVDGIIALYDIRSGGADKLIDWDIGEFDASEEGNLVALLTILERPIFLPRQSSRSARLPVRFRSDPY